MTDIRGQAGHPYQGEDRRQRRPAANLSETGERHALAIATCALIGVAIPFFLGPLVVPSALDTLADGVEPLLNAAAVAVAVIIGVLCFVRWRLVGQACSLWFAAAALTYGLVTIGVGHLVPVLGLGEPAVLMWMHPASRLVVLALFTVALLAPEVDADLRPLRVVGVAIAGVAALTVLFQLLPDLGRMLAGADDLVAQELEQHPGSLILILVLVCVGGVAAYRGARLRRPLFSWFALMLLALAAAEAHRMIPADQLGVWGIGDGMLRIAGLLAAVTGTTRALVSAYGEQGGRLLESVATGATAEARIRAEVAANEERAHEARNALAAIEGATRTLEHYRDRLDPETRASLTEAISGEIARLQNLVSADRAKGAPEPFLVARALRHIITTARSNGMVVEVDIDPELKAFGQSAAIAEVTQNLIENARRYAANSPVQIRTEHEQGGVVVRVEDCGPGIEEKERRAIFTRGTRGRASAQTEGSGLGLYVSLELMREQGGDLWVDDRPGGGASFALWLPTAEGKADPGVDDAEPRRLRAVPSSDSDDARRRSS